MDAYSIVTGIGLEAEGQIRLNRVEAFVLQPVSPDLLYEPNASPLLRQVDESSNSFAANHFKGHVQLITAVAPQAIEQVTGEA